MLLAIWGVSFRLIDIGAGVGACRCENCGITALPDEDVSPTSASPRVMTVNSA